MFLKEGTNKKGGENKNMNDFKKKIASALAAGALLLNVTAPALAGTVTFEVSGNGSDSESEIKFEQENEVTVEQSNYADVLNNVSVKSNTGDNEAEDNTGGDIVIETGDSETSVTVSNTLNSNVAQVESCCLGDVEAKISGNGTDSDNDIDLELENEVELKQYNDATVLNYVDAKSETGDNEAEDNTGGEVSIKTGNASTTVGVSTTANSNSAWVTGGGEEGGGSLSAIISGNGSDSENEIELELENETELEQSNYADILNDVYVKSETGDNEAEDNTGGEVAIETGDATADVTVDNLVNFNWADIDGCGCLEDILAKVSGNGTDSENEIKAELETEKEVKQYNDFDCKGEIKDACAEVDVKLDSGDNEAEDNTLGGEDPTIETGDAGADVEVNNSGNSNVFGGGLDFPELEFDFDFGNWAFLWAWFSGLSS
jgi:hypothetical protein